jgi:hypothetical protein
MKINKNIAVSESGFIFNPTTGESFSANPIGKEILHLMNENKTFEEIKAILSEQYDLDAVTFEKDYNDFVKMLEYNSLTEDNG